MSLTQTPTSLQHRAGINQKLQKPESFFSCPVTRTIHSIFTLSTLGRIEYIASLLAFYSNIIGFTMQRGHVEIYSENEGDCATLDRRAMIHYAPLFIGRSPSPTPLCTTSFLRHHDRPLSVYYLHGTCYCSLCNCFINVQNLVTHACQLRNSSTCYGTRTTL